jgi:hypothetical protein
MIFAGCDVEVRPMLTLAAATSRAAEATLLLQILRRPGVGRTDGIRLVARDQIDRSRSFSVDYLRKLTVIRYGSNNILLCL